MAQFYSKATDANVLSLFTYRFGGAAISLSSVDGETAILVDSDPTGGRIFFSYDPPGSPQDCEIVIRGKRSVGSFAGSTGLGISARTSYPSNNANGYRSSAIDGNVNDLAVYTGGYNSVSRVTTGIVSDTVFHWRKLSVSGDQIKTKVWDGTPQDEPELWDQQITNSTISTAGWVGLFCFSDTNDVKDYITDIGVGTNGDPAPTGPVTPGGSDDLTASDISSTTEVTAPALAQTHALTADDASSMSGVTAPDISQVHSLTAGSVESASATSSPELAQEHALIATSVQSASELTKPALSSASTVDSLSANDISSASATSSPALGQVHNLAANDAASTSETGTPAIQQQHALASVSLDSLSTVSSPALTEIAGQDTLSANDVEATSTVTSPALAQVHVLQPNSAQSQTETGEPAIGQVHQLTANDLASTSQVSSPTLRDASQVLVTPIKNTKAMVSQTTYKAAIIQTVYKAEAS